MIQKGGHIEVEAETEVMCLQLKRPGIVLKPQKLEDKPTTDSLLAFQEKTTCQCGLPTPTSKVDHSKLSGLWLFVTRIVERD